MAEQSRVTVDASTVDRASRQAQAARWHPTSTVLHVSLLVSAGLWGLVFIAIHELLPVLDPVQITVIRFVMLSIGLLVLLVFRPELRPQLSRADWPRVVVGSVAAVPGAQLAAVYGQQYLSPSLAALVVSTAPAWATGFAALLLREHVSRRQAIGLTVALMGVAFITLLGTANGADIEIRAALPGAVTVIGPAAWALYTVVTKPLTTRQPPIGILAVTMIVGTIILAPAMPHAASALPSLHAKEWAWLAYMAIGGSLVPYVSTLQALRTLQASQVTAYMYLVPFFAVGWVAVLLGDLPTWIACVGMALVLGGVYLTQSGGARFSDRAPDVIED